ncbi:MAG: hypothetical protein HFJ84_08050 [Clostridiales bacterium]|nr:hypothetical protein [Clostridiales bacterium]
MCNLHSQEEITQLKLMLEQESRNGDCWYRKYRKAEQELQEIKSLIAGLLTEIEVRERV